MSNLTVAISRFCTSVLIWGYIIAFYMNLLNDFYCFAFSDIVRPTWRWLKLNSEICVRFLLKSRHPEVKWAERADKVYLTVMLPDAKNAKVNLGPEGTFTFSATEGAENHDYELKLDLCDGQCRGKQN
ncbi:hypothetical protein RND81_06G098000 [Saponaria officinalis]|uniref:Co-chaperone protein p23 n=1 Tax=Saponaria officinalis TaxID=3572 RepID=A0AAW1K821_SAPOF